MRNMGLAVAVVLAALLLCGCVDEGPQLATVWIENVGQRSLTDVDFAGVRIPELPPSRRDTLRVVEGCYALTVAAVLQGEFCVRRALWLQLQ